jgi:2-oxo-3-hexenedioate decarboxylase
MTALSQDTIDRLARHLHAARLERREVARLTEEVADLSLADAYRVQAVGVQLRQADGERVVGWKMGLTSKAKREQMNLREPCYGVLTDRMALDDGGELPLNEGIHAKIEPEIAFRLGHTVRGPISFEEACAAIAEVAPAMEILDSRFVGFRYFSLPDVIADNSSSYRYVVGPWQPFGIDLAHLQMTMTVDGQLAESAYSDAISGHPVASLVQLSAMLGGDELPAGAIVLAGAATVAVMLQPGMRVELEVAQLGRVGMTAR